MDGEGVSRSTSGLAGQVFWVLITVVAASPDVRILEPEFNPVPSKMIYTRGDTARLFCSVSNLGERTVVWRKLPSPNPLTIGLDTWVEDERIHVEYVHKAEQWNLIIDQVNAADQGDYECQVSITQRKLRQNIRLEVMDFPVKRHPEILISGVQFVASGSDLHLYCNASLLSDRHQILQWVKDGNLLERDPRRRVSIQSQRSRTSSAQSSLLVVREVTVDDGGEYVCRSSDHTHVTSAHVTVLTAGSNNVKRAGSMMLESRAVGCLPKDITTVVVLLTMFICHVLFT
ncbi:basement membrane-specific heparan sulfate proteoglycan core protein-like isoform X2 [Pomacea canaliculata]|uniref:basement membrane-specific heparan sulfate proteoglycan core protein-like isoform X2 n=1 Tax=Pomacea canaliculata TaxID=400727 RepID=UPI000D729AD2|nr:basement membrane-specific heparan sulfate proteoglycan core protein-like isoform X2 [Pomacea canaliculata]